MKELEGLWWTINQEKVQGKLTITDENKITLSTYKKIYDTHIICGFGQGQKITLLDAELDRIDIYTNAIQKDETETMNDDENTELKYSVYTYTIGLAIFGHIYERKGDIRIKELALYYTKLDEWIDWEVSMPEALSREEDILVKMQKFNEKIIKTEKFKLMIRNPYTIKKTAYKIEINNQVEIVAKDIINESIQTAQGIIQCLQYFLTLCIGDNINVEKIKAIDFFDRNIEIVLGYGKSNYENRSILKNIVKYKDIESDIEKIIKNWIDVYEENELLMVNFVKLHTEKDLLVSEYMNLMSAIESLHLLVTGKEQSKDSCADIIKNLLKETNFILNFSESEMKELSIKAKNIRRYFVHANKTQKQIVHSNISIIKSIMNILIEAIRSRIMLQIGIDSKIIENYYKNIEELKKIKYDIINNVNEEERIIFEEENERRKIMNSLSKKDKESIAELNAIMGTRYRETELNLENSKDLIEAIENATAEYMDYMHYWGELSNIMENFDQSLEVFHPEKWFNMAIGRENKTSLIDETISSLYDASDNMSELASKAEERCKEIWQFMLLGNNHEVQTYFIGSLFKYSKEMLLEAIDDVIENIFEIEYENQVQDDTQNFAKGIKEYLEKESIERKTKQMQTIFIEYPKCSTCKKAKEWLKQNNIKFEERNIVTQTPTEKELTEWIERSGQEIKKWFNTSGLKYKELNLKEKLSNMTDKEKIKLLSSDGMLIKRPILISDEAILIGFKEEKWKEII